MSVSLLTIQSQESIVHTISKRGSRWTLITSNTSAVLAGVALVWLAYQLGVENNTH